MTVQFSEAFLCNRCATLGRASDIHNVATIMPTDGFGEVAHASIAQPLSKVSNNASDRGCCEFLVVPDVPQEIQMCDVLIRAARQSVQQSKINCMPKMQ